MKILKNLFKMKIPDCVTRRNILLIVILIVAITTLLFIVYETKHKRFSFVFRWTQEQNKLSHFCKSLSKKDNVNWNYFYYYENLETKRSLVWCKIPKSASTTMTKLFLHLAGAKNFQNSTRIHKLLRDFYPRYNPKVMKGKIKSSKTFLVVRDPFERILSAYRDKLENYDRDLQYRDGYYYDHYGKFMVTVNKQSPITNNQSHPRKEPTWNEFVRYLLKTSVARFDEHWMPMTRICSPCSVSYDLIIKLENFRSEIKKVLLPIGINTSNLEWAHKTGTYANRQIINSYYKKLSLTDVKKLYTKYKLDFQLFGYTPYKYYRLFKEKPIKSKQGSKL